MRTTIFTQHSVPLLIKEHRSVSSIKIMHVSPVFDFIFIAVVLFLLITSCYSLFSQALHWHSAGKALCKPSGGFPVWYLLWRAAFQEGAVCHHCRAPDCRSWNGKPGSKILKSASFQLPAFFHNLTITKTECELNLWLLPWPELLEGNWDGS